MRIQHEKPVHTGGLVSHIFIVVQDLSMAGLQCSCQRKNGKETTQHSHDHLQVPFQHSFQPPLAIVSFMKLFHIASVSILFSRTLVKFSALNRMYTFV